jgi:prolyl-tRNA editing enzyme YbaK/EbsC (Cys-tRNA(Pro) deacylase)
MSDAVDRFLEASAGLGLEPQIRRFPQGTKTAADAAAAIGCDVGQIVKSLVFMADGAPVLALTSGSNRVAETRLADVVGATQVRRATPEEARNATGFAVGGTPPFGHPEELLTVCDPDLMGYDQVWVAAGTPDSVFPLTPQDLVRLTGASMAGFTEDVA